MSELAPPSVPPPSHVHQHQPKIVRIPAPKVPTTAAYQQSTQALPPSKQLPRAHPGNNHRVRPPPNTNSMNLMRQQGTSSMGQPRQRPVHIAQSRQMPSTSSMMHNQPTIRIPPPSGPPSTTQMRPVIVSRAHLASMAIPHVTSDDHKFKKPLLPVKHRNSRAQQSFDEERKKREHMDDATRVQMHVMEATRKSQEAAAASAAQKAVNLRAQQLQQPIQNRQAPKQVQQPPKPVELPRSIVSDTQKANLNLEVIDVPNLLVHSSFIFRYVVSKHAYMSLSGESREHLKKFLPNYETAEEENKLLDCAFTRSQKLVKGNPVDTVHKRLKLGWYNPDRYYEFVHIRDSNKVMYDHYIRFYHMNLMQKLLASRHLVLSHYDHSNARDVDSPGPQPQEADTVRQKMRVIQMKKRATKRSRLMVSDCRTKVGEHGISSDEEDEDAGPAISKALSTNNCQRSTLFTPKSKDLDLHQPLQCDDVKTMLKKFKKLKRRDPKCPSMQLKGIVLDEVFDRAGVLAQSEKIKQTVADLERGLKD